MPLRRSPGVPRITSDWVEFPMEDTLTKSRVDCRASYGALRKIGGSASSSRDQLLAAFHQERARIEAKADIKYIAGQNPPHIFPEPHRLPWKTRDHLPFESGMSTFRHYP
jgi:hypothetical protein